MSEINKLSSHLKFLKSNPITQFEVGSYVPQDLQVDEDPIDNAFCFNISEKGSVIFIISVSCSVCKIDSIQLLTKLYPEFQYILFTDGTKEDVEQQRLFLNQVEIVRANIFHIIRQLGIPGVPYALGINSDGQIVSGRPFDSIESLKKAISPLLEVYYNEVL
ncbi:hypothetical protein MHB40_19595 [Lysinibacillus sp. FSL K6-0057]|jgi:hypothetical protein|uniref:hypothetical protein n=1 Tax=unclassified Lysinibacillus TaxID=2636778 RepID=UPI0031596478